MNTTQLHGKTRQALLALCTAGLLASAGPVCAEGEAAIEIVHQGIPHDSLYAIEMSGEWGLAVGNFGLMLETSDGGQSWQLQEPATTLALLGVSRAGTHQLVVGQQGLAMTREDGGDWTVVDTGFTQRLLNVDMNEQGLAVAVGEFGFVARSRDFGASWEAITIDWNQYNEEGYEPHMYGALVLADGTIFVTGEFGMILRSTDDGDSFEAVNQGEESVFDIHLARDGSNTGYAVGQEGFIVRTADGGSTWQRLDVDTNANLLGVWSGNGEVVITGIREMLRSSDDGASFTRTEDINVIRTWFQGIAAGVAETQTGNKGFLREQSIYIVGHRGTIARVLQ